MGKRKSSKKPQVKQNRLKPLDKSFRCLFCQHAGTVLCKIDKTELMGYLECSSCGQKFASPTNHLSQEIDIYSDWIDATEQANRAQAVEEEEEDFERPAEPRRDEGVRDKRRREAHEEVIEEDDEEEQQPRARPRREASEEADGYDSGSLPDI